LHQQALFALVPISNIRPIGQARGFFSADARYLHTLGNVLWFPRSTLAMDADDAAN
jgi:hypothetical protein